MPEIPRRDFLKITRDGLLYLSGALALGGLFRFLNFQTEPAPQTEFDLGLADNYPPGTQTLLSDVPAVLIHSDQGFSAIILMCTHLGCTISQAENGFACPCHGSQFDSKGDVLHGPAIKELQSFRVEQLPDGHLFLYTNK
jgi:cytochrome b6-f complex iron-sulfur subunit